MADRFLRLKFILPAGTVVRTRVVTPKVRLGAIDLFGGASIETSEARCNHDSTLELDIPEEDFDALLAALHAAKR